MISSERGLWCDHHNRQASQTRDVRGGTACRTYPSTARRSLLTGPDYHYHLGDYYHSRPVAVAFEAGIVLLCLYLCQWAIERIPKNKAFEVLFLWSKDVNRIYLIQWTLIMWGACAAFGFDENSYAMTVGIMLFMLAATHVLNGFYSRIKEILAERKTAWGAWRLR